MRVRTGSASRSNVPALQATHPLVQLPTDLADIVIGKLGPRLNALSRTDKRMLGLCKPFLLNLDLELCMRQHDLSHQDIDRLANKLALTFKDLKEAHAAQRLVQLARALVKLRPEEAPLPALQNTLEAILRLCRQMHPGAQAALLAALGEQPFGANQGTETQCTISLALQDIGEKNIALADAVRQAWGTKALHDNADLGVWRAQLKTFPREPGIARWLLPEVLAACAPVAWGELKAELLDLVLAAPDRAPALKGLVHGLGKGVGSEAYRNALVADPEAPHTMLQTLLGLGLKLEKTELTDVLVLFCSEVLDRVRANLRIMPITTLEKVVIPRLQKPEQNRMKEALMLLMADDALRTQYEALYPWSAWPRIGLLVTGFSQTRRPQPRSLQCAMRLANHLREGPRRHTVGRLIQQVQQDGSQQLCRTLYECLPVQDRHRADFLTTHWLNGPPALDEKARTDQRINMLADAASYPSGASRQRAWLGIFKSASEQDMEEFKTWLKRFSPDQDEEFWSDLLEVGYQLCPEPATAGRNSKPDANWKSALTIFECMAHQLPRKYFHGHSTQFEELYALACCAPQKLAPALVNELAALVHLGAHSSHGRILELISTMEEDQQYGLLLTLARNLFSYSRFADVDEVVDKLLSYLDSMDIALHTVLLDIVPAAEAGGGHGPDIWRLWIDKIFLVGADLDTPHKVSLLRKIIGAWKPLALEDVPRSYSDRDAAKDSYELDKWHCFESLLFEVGALDAPDAQHELVLALAKKINEVPPGHRSAAIEGLRACANGVSEQCRQEVDAALK